MAKILGKLPDGLSCGAVIKTNRRYRKAYRNSPKDRAGTIIAASSVKGSCWVILEGKRHRELLNRNFFDLVGVS
jgi:hypothetical protein